MTPGSKGHGGQTELLQSSTDHVQAQVWAHTLSYAHTRRFQIPIMKNKCKNRRNLILVGTTGGRFTQDKTSSTQSAAMSELRNDLAGPWKATPKNEDPSNAPSLRPGGMAVTAAGSAVVLATAPDTEAESGDVSRTAQEAWQPRLSSVCADGEKSSQTQWSLHRAQEVTSSKQRASPWTNIN